MRGVKDSNERNPTTIFVETTLAALILESLNPKPETDS